MNVQACAVLSFTNWDSPVEYVRISNVVGCVGGLSAWASSAHGPVSSSPTNTWCGRGRQRAQGMGRAPRTGPGRVMTLSRTDAPVPQSESAVDFEGVHQRRWSSNHMGRKLQTQAASPRLVQEFLPEGEARRLAAGIGHKGSATIPWRKGAKW